MNRILITGSHGFIGSSLADSLGSYDDNYIVGVDNLSTGSKNNHPLYLDRFIKADVNDYQQISEIMLSEHFDYVFHYAATVGVRRTQDNPCMVLDDIQGIRNICILSKNTGVKHLYFSSSSEVYGEPVHFPQNESTTPLNSRLPYAVVKNIGEAFLQSYYKEHLLPYTIFRFFNTYGPKQSPNFVVSKFINQAINNQDITIYGDGKQSRTFCYIDDNIDTVQAIFTNKQCINDIVNIGSTVETTIQELAWSIINITGSKSKVIHLPPLTEGDMTRRLPDNSKMMKILNRSLLTLEEGITRILSI